MQRSHSINAIRKALKRSPSTISREIPRNTKRRQYVDQ
ncbi:MAG: helix-turn-helix domain-containing protein, partial [Endozoicomonadaceae bacterium]|nr:helix-turn-helix domain-containing protein [Endozoicomonadaceae bacterium]